MTVTHDAGSSLTHERTLVVAGWNDVGWHNPAMITPNLNRYAKQGVILNDSYVQPVCSP